MKAAREAATEFVNNIPPNASIGLVEFGGSARLLVELAPNNHGAVLEAIQSLRHGGGTPMTKALENSLTELQRAGYSQYGYGEYHQVLLGDGAPGDASSTGKMMDHMAQKTPVNVTAIGFCANLDMLKRTAVNFQPANNADELRSAFASVLAEAEQFSDQGF